MFKSCRNLFNLSRKLGSVVGGLGLAGVLFAGQVSAAPRWSQSDIRHLACVVRELVNSGRQWTWEMVAEQLSSSYGITKNAETCRKKWSSLSEQNPQYREIYAPSSRSRAIPSTPWTNEDIEHLADVVRELVNSGRNWTWKMVATEFNSQTNQEKTPDACRVEWSRLLKQNPRYREIHDLSSKAVPSTPWTNEDIEHLADVVRKLVEAVSNGYINHWTWKTVATEFNSQTNQERTPEACRIEWSKLAKQYPQYREVYDPRVGSWTDGDKEHLANIVEGLVNSGRKWTWNTVAVQFNHRTNKNRTAGACSKEWIKLAEQDEEFRNVYDPKAVSWTDEDIRHLADIVRDLVRAGNGINWDIVAEEFNSRTNEERTSVACLNKWRKLAEQNEEFRSIYTPKAISFTPWTDEDIRHLADVVREIVNSGRNWTWKMVAIEFNSRTNEERTSVACLNKWYKLAEQDEEFRNIYDPKAISFTPWTDEDIRHLADVVREIVNSGRNWTWKMVAIEFNSRTNQERTAVACLNKWYKLAEQDEEFRNIYDPKAVSWTDEDIRHLADIVGDLVRAGNGINWDIVAEEFNSRTNQERTSVACLMKWHKLAKQNEAFRSIYDPSSTPWTDDDIGYLSSAVFRVLVRASRNDTIDWDTVAEEFNSLTNENRTPDACRKKWSELAKQNELYRYMYDPSSNSRSEASRRVWGSRRAIDNRRLPKKKTRGLWG